MRSSHAEAHIRDLHGAEVQFIVTPHEQDARPDWLKLAILAPIAAGLILLAVLLIFVAVGVAWLAGVAFFGPAGGLVFGVAGAVLAFSALALGLASRA